MAKLCDLPSRYGSLNPSEDFAENFAQLLCDKRSTLSKRHQLLKSLIDSTTPARQQAFRCAILASRASDSGNQKDALQRINQAIASAPDVAPFYVDRSCYRSQSTPANNLHQQKLHDLQKARDIFGSHKVPDYDNNVRALNQKMANLWWHAKDYRRQKIELLKMLKNDPNNADTLTDLADCYLYLHDSKNAAIFFDKAVSADELCAGAYRLRSHIRVELQNYDDALKDVILALYIEPKNEWSLFQKSKCLYYLGQQRAARGAVLEVLALNSKDLGATRALCLIDFEMGDYDRCTKEADAANVVKKRADVDSIKAHALVRLKRFVDGEKLIKEALTQNIDDARDVWDAYICLGEAEIGLKQRTKAIQALQQALKLQPQSTLTKSLLKKANSL